LLVVTVTCSPPRASAADGARAALVVDVFAAAVFVVARLPTVAFAVDFFAADFFVVAFFVVAFFGAAARRAFAVDRLAGFRLSTALL
jgi:hypothetical protein